MEFTMENIVLQRMNRLILGYLSDIKFEKIKNNTKTFFEFNKDIHGLVMEIKQNKLELSLVIEDLLFSIAMVSNIFYLRKQDERVRKMESKFFDNSDIDNLIFHGMLFERFGNQDLLLSCHSMLSFSSFDGIYWLKVFETIPEITCHDDSDKLMNLTTDYINNWVNQYK